MVGLQQMIRFITLYIRLDEMYGRLPELFEMTEHMSGSELPYRFQQEASPSGWPGLGQRSGGRTAVPGPLAGKRLAVPRL